MDVLHKYIDAYIFLETTTVATNNNIQLIKKTSNKTSEFDFEPTCQNNVDVAVLNFTYATLFPEISKLNVA